MNHEPLIPHFYTRCVFAILPIFITLCSLKSLGQIAGSACGHAEIQGRVQDTALKKNCSLTTIVLLDPDSILIKFTRSRKDGSFFFHNLAAGQYRLLVTHPAYSDCSLTITLTDSVIADLGIVSLSPRSDVLTAVIVTPKYIPPRMNRDTLEYNTTNVKLNSNANIEELLSRLPGVKIDQNGGITVNGQKIQRLLVDGEDLFASDPSIVMRNFNADMISKVQVLDKKSSQSEFTGVDDGQITKTINLSLNKNKKKGYFTKMEAGANPQGYYNCNGLLGSFKGSRQFAALGAAANTGNNGFSGTIGDLGTGLTVSGAPIDALHASTMGGIPRIHGGGLHYANKWNDNEGHLAGNYQYGQLVTNPVSSSRTEQILPDSIYVQNQQSKSMNNQEQQHLSVDYDYIPDTISALKFSLAGKNMQGHNEFASNGNSAFNGNIVNNSLRTIHSDVQNQSFNSNFMWRIRGKKKKERVFSILAGIAKQDNTTKGYLFSLNNFFNSNGNLKSSDTTDQRKTFNTTSLILNGSFSYTEPLWKNAVLGFSYGVSFNKSQSLQSTYNKGDGKYEIYVDSLSNHYENNLLTERATVNLQVNDKTLDYTIGGDILHSSYRQVDLLKNGIQRYRYFNFAPRINAKYSLTAFKGFNFNYNGSTEQPAITQLQPVQNNNDPLHVTIGNPKLFPSFSHDFAVNFYNFKPVVLNVGMNFGLTTNSISTRVSTDSLGRQISQAVNVNGSRHSGLYFSINKKLKNIDLDISFNTNLSYSRSVSYIGNLLSNNDNYNTGGELSLSKYVPDKYNFSINSGVTYTYSQSLINTGVQTRYWTQAQNFQLSIFPIKNLEINTNGYYNWRQKTSTFDQNNSMILWNAFINKLFLRSRIALRCQVNNILNENTGITRNIYINQISESNFNVIGRYWLFSVTYQFTSENGK